MPTVRESTSDRADRGLDNRVATSWDLRRGRRRRRLRICSPWTFMFHPAAGRARRIRALPLGDGTIGALVSDTADGRSGRWRPPGSWVVGCPAARCGTADVAGTATWALMRRSS